MSSMQNTRDAARTEIQNQTRDVVRVRRAADAPQAPEAPAAPDAPAAPVLAPVPDGGGRLIIDQDGPRTTITSHAMPPEFMPLARMAQETVLGLMGLLAAIVILGPFARMLARRLERKAEMKTVDQPAIKLQEQILQLQQSIDAMSVEMERIGESQRFQSKLLANRPADIGVPR